MVTESVMVVLLTEISLMLLVVVRTDNVNNVAQLRNVA